MSSIKFLAEISRRVPYKPLPTPSTDISREFNIYLLYLGNHPTNSYWLDWGGWYDNEITTRIELYYRQWLYPVSSVEDLKQTPNSLFISGNYVMINLPKHPWLYSKSDVIMAVREGYLSSPKSEKNPSDIYLGNQKYEARFEIPTITVKLSDVISGMTKYSTFDIQLINNDGKFDGADTRQFFNAPAYIRKTEKDNPNYDDFLPIRQGLVENITSDNKLIKFTVSDKFRAMNETFLTHITDYMISPDDKQDVVGKTLPLIYGTGVNITLTELYYFEQDFGTGQKIVNARYFAGSNLTAVTGVYTANGTEILSSNWTFQDGIISVNQLVVEKAMDIKAKSALVNGNTENRLGYIVTDIIAKIESQQYNATNWDLTETNAYRNNSPRVNIAFSSGDVKKAVSDLLKSDMAFLIQKASGVFTIRKWGGSYPLHNIESWRLTQQPQKDYADAEKNWFSRCAVKYKYNYASKEYEAAYQYIDKEDEARGNYTRSVEREFETNLITKAAAQALAVEAGNRFCDMKATFRIACGFDTSQFNLLDKVKMKMTVNGRTYSEKETWVIKEIDPAQDKLLLEEL